MFLRTPRRLGPVLALSLLLAAAGCGGDDDSEAASSAPRVTIRVGEQAPVRELSLRLSGLDADLPYDVEYVRFNSGPLTNEGFAAGEIDLGSMGDTPVIGAAARDLPVSVLTTNTVDGPGSLLVARPESGIATVADLKGKRIAFTTGTAQHGFVLRVLDSIGLKQSDVEQVDVPLQDLPSVLESGDADASVITYEAEVKYKRAHPDAVRLASVSQLDGVASYTLVADEAIADPAKAEAIYDYVDRIIKANEWTKTNAEEWVEEYYVKERKQAPEDAALVYEGTGDSTFVPVTDEVIADHQRLADLLLEAGGLEAAVEVSTVYNPAIDERVNAIVTAAAQS